MAKNVFTDPKPAGLGVFNWLVNHTEQEGPARVNNLDFGGRSDGRGVIATQGDWEPLFIRLSGTLLHQAQNIAFWKFRHISNTFIYEDFEGNEFEVVMTSYEPRQIRVALNIQDPTMQYYKIEYNMELWVRTILAGNFLTAGVPV